MFRLLAVAGACVMAAGIFYGINKAIENVTHPDHYNPGLRRNMKRHPRPTWKRSAAKVNVGTVLVCFLCMFTGLLVLYSSINTTRGSFFSLIGWVLAWTIMVLSATIFLLNYFEGDEK